MGRRLSGLVIALWFSGVGCGASEGFQRSLAANPVQAATPQVDDREVQVALERRPQLPERARVAVHFAAPEMDGVRLDSAALAHQRFSMADRKRVLDALNAQPNVDAFPINEAILQNVSYAYTLDLHALRVAAAQHGADALLIVTLTGASARNANAAATTYAALAPMLFVPGTHLDAVVVARAVLWDVRNRYLYASAEAEGTSAQTRPLAFIDAETALNEAKKDSLLGLDRELRARMTRLMRGG